MKKQPLVMCLTNTVAANFTANVLLAIGAKPAMVEEPEEAVQLARLADAVLVNVGTLHARQAEAISAAIESIQGRVPWVLDPVACPVLDYRCKFITSLLTRFTPAIIRGNQVEIETLLQTSPELVSSVPAILATGVVDCIYQPSGVKEEISGGVEMLQLVTATGCAQGAICAAFLGWGQTPAEACFSASRVMKRAGERAYAKATCPGSFQSALLDALWELNHA